MNKKQALTNINQRITDAIVAQMEAGANWLKPFTGAELAPTNALTGKQYNGVNRLYLSLVGGGYFATWKQWKQLGATWKEGVSSDTDSHPVIYAAPKIYEKKNSKGEKESRKVYLTQWSNVYSAHDVELPEKLEAKLFGDKDEPVVDLTKTLEEVDTYIKNIGCAIRHQGSATEHYYSTLFHEITHWTGSDLRLKRTKGKFFGDAEYGFEELCAELGAAFHCQARGIAKVDDTRESHATYLASWIKGCKDQPDAIMKAARLAQASVTYCDSLQPDAAEKAA